MEATCDKKEDAVRPLQLHLIVKIFGLLEPFRVKRNWLLFIVLLRSLLQPAFAWAVGAIIDGPIRGGASMMAITTAVGGLLLLSIVMQITLHFRQRLTLELGESVVNDLRRRIFEHLQMMSMDFYNRTKLGRILSRISGDCNSVRIGVQDVFFTALIGIGQMIFSGLLMAIYSLSLFSIVLAMTPLFFVANYFFRSRLGQAYRDIQENFSRVTSWIAENISGMKVSQAFVRGPFNADQFDGMIRSHAAMNMKATRLSGVFLPIIELNSQLFMAALIAVGGYLVLQPNANTSLGDLIQFFFLANIFFGPIQVLATQYNQALTAMAGAERVFGLLAETVDPIDTQATIQLDRIAGRVTFSDVTFGYETDKPVLHNISFDIQPGQFIALVGQSGGGKSTITNLIARHYLANSGKVLIDGNDIATIVRESLTRHIAIVPQQNFLFTGTIADNLRMAVPNATDRQLRDALAELDCLDIVEKLPRGLQCVVGSRGASLSSGQRQLICLARALLMKPSILILDEATSSIDIPTERRLQKAISTLQADRTLIVVAHRLTTIQYADQIFVLDGGKLVECGNHEQLQHQNGYYAAILQRYQSAAG